MAVMIFTISTASFHGQLIRCICCVSSVDAVSVATHSQCHTFVVVGYFELAGCSPLFGNQPWLFVARHSRWVDLLLPQGFPWLSRLQWLPID